MGLYIFPPLLTLYMLVKTSRRGWLDRCNYHVLERRNSRIYVVLLNLVTPYLVTQSPRFLHKMASVTTILFSSFGCKAVSVDC